MKYRNRITLWAAVIAVGLMTAVSVIERSRAYKLADIINEEAEPADTVSIKTADTLSVAADSLALDSLAVAQEAVRLVASDSSAVDSLKKDMKKDRKTEK